MSTNAEARLKVLVSGRVQGVGFRDFVVWRARELGLKGSVRNRADGRMECIAEGSRESLEQLLAAIREGPQLARVEDMETNFEEPQGDLDGFGVEF